MERVIYTKCSTERKSKYKILTSIIEKDNHRYVRKMASNPLAMNHVNHMFEYYNMKNQYGSDNVLNVPCKQIADGCVEFEYISGVSYAEKMQQFATEKNLDKLIECVSEIRDIIINVPDKTEFVLSQEFEEIFGTQFWLNGAVSAKNVNIDLLAENILLVDDTKYIIDYELTFPFDIPLKYVVFRMLFFNTTIAALSDAQKRRIYSRCEISEVEYEKFYKMELLFQSYISGNSLDDVNKKIGMKKFLLSQENEIIPEVKYSIFSKENGALLNGSLYGNKLKLQCGVNNEKKVALELKCDVCTVKILNANADIVDSNHSLAVNEDWYFINEPIIYFNVNEIDTLELDVQVLNYNNSLVRYVIAFADKGEELEKQLLRSGDEVSELVQKVNKLTEDILNLNEKYDMHVKRSEETISQLGSELARIKSTKGYEKFAKKNNIYEG